MALIAEFLSTATTFEDEWIQMFGTDISYNNAYLSIIADSEYNEFQMLFRTNIGNSVLTPFGGTKKIDDETPFITGFRHLLIQTQCQPMLIELITDYFIITNVIEYEDGIRNVFMCIWVDDEAWWVIFDGPRFIYEDANYNENDIFRNDIISINPDIFNIMTSEFYIMEIDNISNENIIMINIITEIAMLYRTWYELFGDIGSTTTQ
jgi:hypothetical protein